METRRTCVIAMSHITEATAKHLMTCDHAAWPVMGGRLGPDTLIIYAHTELDEQAESYPDLAAVITWARAQPTEAAGAGDPGGYEYVILDNDAAPAPGLHDYMAHERLSPLASIIKQLADKAAAHDKGLNEGDADEGPRVPDADDYNALLELIGHAERAAQLTGEL